SFFNSSTSYRVRIALALKKLDFNFNPVNIRVAEHKAPGYVEKNPGASVPLLVDDGFELGQSMAIIDYLDAKYPEPRLIPQDLQARARVLEISNLISCDMHPLNNKRVLLYLTRMLKAEEGGKNIWYQHWITEGFHSVEQLLARTYAGTFCHGDQVSLADCCLVPQVANALRMNCNLENYPRINAIYAYCNSLDAFRQAMPEAQPDYQE
ncbi:maleylacetoacetate isomerase, partial [Pusillimonas noertemannii]